MMLRQLYDLARREQLVADPDYEPKAISFIVVVGGGGALRSIISTLTPPPSGKGKSVAKRLMVPRETVRTSAVQPQFLWDNAQYVFGISVDTKKTKSAEALQRCRESFRSAVEAAAEATKDSVLRDVATFLRTFALMIDHFPRPAAIA